MRSNAIYTPPVLFVLVSFIAGLMNFVDTSVRLLYIYMLHTSYPLSIYLKPVFLIVQAFSLLLLLATALRMPKEQISFQKLYSFLAVQLILAVLVLLLYIDFLFVAVVGLSSSLIYIELALNLSYLVVLTGTCLWFALWLLRNDKWKWVSIVFVMIGLAFGTFFLERMFFWSQNYTSLALPGKIAEIGMYGPHVFMFLAGILAVLILFLKTSTRNASGVSKPLLLLFIPAFFLPFFWKAYKDGLINFVLMGFIYWSFGYVGAEWYSISSVSLYLVTITSYFLVLKGLSQQLTSSVASALIILGVASLPFNGITLFYLNYSSIPGNLVSLNSIIMGASLLSSRWRNAVVT